MKRIIGWISKKYVTAARESSQDQELNDEDCLAAQFLFSLILKRPVVYKMRSTQSSPNLFFCSSGNLVSCTISYWPLVFHMREDRDREILLLTKIQEEEDKEDW